MVDIPRLLMREKAQRARRNGVTLQDRVLGEPQALGRMTAGPMARVANLVNVNRLVRGAMGKTAGIAPAFPLPPFGTTSFPSWLAHHTPAASAGKQGKVALFATCLADYNLPPHRAHGDRGEIVVRQACREERLERRAAGTDVLRDAQPRR